MRMNERMKKTLNIVLCLCMLVQNAPVMAFAATTDNLCDHHPKHTEDCGYVEAVAGSACTHKHSEACYEIVECKHTCSDECGDPCTTHTCTVDDGCITRSKDCHHVHGECGYAEAVEPQDCTTCQPVLVHAQNCGYVESADEVTCACEPTVIHGGEGCTYVEGKDGSPCTHVCAVVVDSDDSCYKLLCSHKDGGHDDTCGYAAAVEGHACNYECSACEDNAGDDSPVPEGVCAHGNSEENCETCVGEIQVMINALPDMEDIGDHNRADVISQLEAIDDRMWKLSDAAKGKLNADKYVDAAFVLSAPEGFFGFLLTKRYEAGASAMPQASFAFLDASGVAATVITPEEQQTTSVEPVSNGGAVRGYLPVGEYTLNETVVGDWNLTMSVNGQAEGDHTFTGEGGRAYRIETINTKHILIQLTPSENGSVEVETNDNVWNENGNYLVAPGKTVTLTVTPAPGYELGVLKVKPESADEAIVPTGSGNTYTFVAPDYNVTVTATFKPLCEHTTENAENQATCKKQAVCDLCGESYGDVNKKNHDETVEYDNGFCSYCDAYQSATLNAEGYYEISNAGQLYWFAEQVNSGNYSINGKLMDDILVNEEVLNSAGIVSGGPFRTWYPIGSTEDVNYSGTFNGNGKTISGLYFNTYNVDGVGLFGYVDSGEIQNVGIKDSYFNGGDNVGSVVAHNHKGTVTGCYNTGTVSGGSNVGGVVGKNDEGTVTDCYNSGRIGSNDCNNVGGVLGGNIGTVSNCYNTGSISGRDCVGGVAGYSGGKVSNCYNTDEVYGQNMVGGVLGLNEGDSTLSNCYNTGTVFGSRYVGGVAGENKQGTISNCYYLTGSAMRGIGEGNDTTEDKTEEAFASGEVAALLGEPFGQNIDNGQDNQGIPCFSGAEVYAVKNCKEETVYSNTNENIGHKWENGKCSICDASCSHSGSQHTTGTSKDESTHSYTCSICRSVATENHSFNSDTGECQYCKTEMAVAKVEIGENTTYYKTLDEAVTAAEADTAEAPATLTLLKDIDLEDSYPTISSGVMILDLNGCKLTGSDYYVLDITGNATGKTDVTITDSREGGTISATQLNGHGVRANNSTVTINGGTVSGDGYGVSARQGTVTITGGTISGGAAGVNADSNSTVTISGGAISNGTYGVIANFGTVEITGGTITGTSSGVDAYKSTVKISGGTITGGNYDLEVSDTASIILGLGKDGTGATFPDGLNVNGKTLKAILGERAAYWQNDKMLTDIDGYSISGTVTVKEVCKHENATYPTDGITNTQHKIDCSCGYKATENHTFDSTTGKCQYCKTEMAEASVKIGDTTTYYKTLDAAITDAESCVEADNAVVTLLKDINLGASYQRIDSGVFTLDLNGCILTGSHSSYGVLCLYECNLTITDGSAEQDGTITGTYRGVEAYNSTLEISGGTISGYYGVNAHNNSTVRISGGTITATNHGVEANISTVEISDGTVTATGGNSCGVFASTNSTVEISGGTISGTKYGVNANQSTVTIEDGTISASDYGVYASGGAVTINGGTISANDCGVYAYDSAVTISGGTITGGYSDLQAEGQGTRITLGLGENNTGATFPDGLTVDGTTLVDILDEDAAYWQGTKMLTNIADEAITITGGTVTVKAVCEHGNATYQQITNTQHTLVCSECLYSVTENHTLTYTASGNVITESCSTCNATLGTATISAEDKTYDGESVTAAVQTTDALNGSNIVITYSQNGEELNESAIRAGTYTASIKLGDAVAKVNFTITPATLPNAVLSETGYTYNGQQQKPAVIVTGRLTENTDYTVTYPQDVTNAGEKTVTITGKGNYTGTVTKSYSIAKADSVVTKAPQAAANLVYNGKNQNLVIAGTVTGGTLQYSLDGKTWAAKIPVGKAAGTYTVSYKVVGDANHKDIAVRTLAVTIAKGTAPAVDALVQTHFYAYATANTVDLAKYLPADRGTTAYTAIGVSADIFSSVLSVTNAGVLSYTTRKLTAAPASDTQICINVVMENYADAELTVTVKLLAVTAQTQQKIVKTELTEVPAGLAGTRFHSVNAIKTEQKRVLGLLLGYDPQGNILHYDVKLQFSPDGGKTWVDATEENFPANGLTVTLPYPSGTGKDTHNFVVSHMFTTGAKAGTIETPAVTKTADGIQFTVTGLSPVSVAWSAIPFDVKVANVTNGTVYVSSAQAAAGTQVTITATPKSGYRLSSLAVKDAAGNSYTVSTDNNDKYYFIMPAADVTVTATFTAKSTAVADTTNPKTGDDSNLVFWNSMAMTSLLALAALLKNKKKYYQK